MPEPQAAGPIPPGVLASIEVPAAKPAKPAEPCCGNCPFHATDPLKVNAPIQCREDAPKVLGVVMPNNLGHPAWQTISVWPNVERSTVCGKHPVLRARAEKAYKLSLGPAAKEL